MRKAVFIFLRPILAVILGISLGLLVTFIAGESPLHVLKIILRSAFGSPYDFGMTLFYSTPLIFTGLSVAVAFHAGLFNIGAEGQLVMGAMAAACVGILLPQIPAPYSACVAAIAAFMGGAFWGAIPGWLRAKRGSHEVINTIMLNFIATGLTSWMTLYIFRSMDTQSPETRTIGANYLLKNFAVFKGAPVSISLGIAILAALGIEIFLRKSVRGFQLRAVGQNENAAAFAGIDCARNRIFAMTLAGGLAGLVGIGEVLGNAGRFKIGFSPDYGFIGIAVALLGRNKPLGIVLSALLFGALHKGAMDLDFDTENVTRDLSLMLQALVIVTVSADGLWDWTNRSKRREA